MVKYLLIGLICFAVVSGEMLPSMEYSHSVTVNSGNMKIFWNFNESHIVFEVQGKTTGWLGIGVSPNGAMTRADIHVGWVKNGVVTVTDRYGVSNSFPPLDPAQDVNVITGSECDGWTMMKFSRQLAACDNDFDREITQHTERLIWALGEEDPVGDDIQPMNYHGARRGVENVHFLESPNLPSRLPTGPEYKTFDLVMDNFLIPSNMDTYYNCKIFKLPALGKKHHVVKFEPVIQKGHEQFVHHMLLYRCDDIMENEEELGKNEKCFSRNMQHFKTCTTTIADWAIGAGATFYPEAAGLSIGANGDPIFVQVEIHYDNPSYQSGILDNSGFRFTYTDTLRQYDVGVMVTGVRTVGVENMIPPNVENFSTVGHCRPSCLSKSLGESAVENITVFSVLLHSHLAGRKLRLRHFRNGEELPFLADDEFYNFNYQDARTLDPYATIGPDDYLRTECVYNTIGRNKVTEFGLSTQQEMCVTFVSYYPKIDLGYCVSSTPYQVGFQYFGIKEQFNLNIEGLAEGHPYLHEVDITELVNATSTFTMEDQVNSIPWSPERAKHYENFIRTSPFSMGCVPQNRSQTVGGIFRDTMPKKPQEKYPKECTVPDIPLSQSSDKSVCYSTATVLPITRTSAILGSSMLVTAPVVGALIFTAAFVLALRRSSA